MNIIRFIAVLSLALLTSGGVYSQEVPRAQKTQTDRSSAAGSAVEKKDKTVGGSGVKELPKLERPERPGSSGKVGKAELSDAVKQLLEDIKAAQDKFLEEQKELQEKVKKATDDQRDKIRLDIRDKRERFLQQQKDMREEFRKRVIELKDELTHHGEVLGEAKDDVRARARERKGGDR